MRLIMRKDRKLLPLQKVRVYRNLHNGMFSIADLRTGRVLGYAETVWLTGGVTFHVRQNGRQRVLEEKKKNVHAWVSGRYFGFAPVPDDVMKHFREAYYDPYEVPYFVDAETGVRVKKAKTAILKDGKAYYSHLWFGYEAF